MYFIDQNSHMRIQESKYFDISTFLIQTSTLLLLRERIGRVNGRQFIVSLRNNSAPGLIQRCRPSEEYEREETMKFK